MNLAEVMLALALLPLPPLLGLGAALLRRPWWWAAAAATVVALVSAIAPEPEPGQSRLAAGDLGFVLVVALWVAGLAWLGWYLTRRFWLRDGGRSTATP